MEIKVTAKHIQKGKPRQPCFCPVALALKEKLHREVNAGPYDLFYLVKKKIAGETMTPFAVSDFMRKYDRGETVEPFTFEVSFRGTKKMSIETE